jgi:Inhibitor of apoptosis-promoting Bax1
LASHPVLSNGADNELRTSGSWPLLDAPGLWPAYRRRKSTLVCASTVRVYSYMAAGLGISGIVAYLAVSTGLYQQIVGTPLIWIVMLAPLGMVLLLSFGVDRISVGAAFFAFWIFAGLMELREALLGIGLKSFAKTTGGKGLHVVVPLVPKLGWDQVRAFAKWMADSFVAQRPKDFTANMAKTARQGRIFIDYLRNSRGATAVGAYTPRAREGAPVSTPLLLRRPQSRNGPHHDRAVIKSRRAGVPLH